MAKSGRIEDTAGFEVDTETEMALSVMESGCFALISGSRFVFCIKGLAPPRGVRARFVFERIDRDEFPSVCAVIFLEAEGGFRARHEYFFSLDSESDLRLLDVLRDSPEVDLRFFNPSDGYLFGLSVRFERDEKLQVSAALEGLL